MRLRTHLAAVASVATAVALFSLTGCAPEPAPDPPHETSTFGDHASALDEYIAAQLVYELPEGQEYPAPTFTDMSGTYESGFGTSAAVLVWNCAWGREYLATRGVDALAATHALEQFAAIMDTPTFENSYDPVSAHPLFRNAVEDAQLGDPTGIRQLVDGSCPR